MGDSLSKIREDAEKGAELEKQKQAEALKFLENMLQTKMDTFETSLKHPPDDEHEVPLGTFLQTHTEYKINVSSEATQVNALIIIQSRVNSLQILTFLKYFSKSIAQLTTCSVVIFLVP